MNKKELAKLVVEALKKEYPDAICSLEYKDPLQLLISTRLAAQCTDARVNIVTPALFKRFSNVNDFADADVEEVQRYIASCGLYKTKSKDIVEMCKKIRDDFNGSVPDTMEELTSLPGVGRKTANLILGDIFGKPAVVVDTHCIRITRRIGFHNLNDARKIEYILKDIIDENESSDFCHRLVIHGRKICTARNPKCDNCIINKFCNEYINKNNI